MPGAVTLSFSLFLLSFVVIGALSARKRRTTTEDYLVASRSITPWMTALSAVATNNSGYMFIGLIGWTYAVGLSSMWLMVGWITGDYLAWRWVYRRVRVRSEEGGIVTIPSFLGEGLGYNGRWVIRLSAVATLVFLGVYAAAQLKAGSKALHVLFGWDISVGIIIGSLIVVLYCFSGGIRASIWTDVLQSILMLGSMALLLAFAIHQTGGMDRMWAALDAIDPGLTDPIPRDLKFGFLPFLIGWIVAGLGVVGQPHVMVRAMAINSADGIETARKIYIIWYILFSAASIAVGLAARVLLEVPDGFDAELALPLLSTRLLPPLLVGLILAGLFSATMSTADSQILSCSAALTHDLFPRWRGSYWMAKVGTLIVTAAVVGIALSGPATVFALVVLAWSALASALGPLLIVRACRWPVDWKVALGMIVGGLFCMLGWRFGLGLSRSIYEVLPGMAGGFLCYVLFKPKRPGPTASRPGRPPDGRG